MRVLALLATVLVTAPAVAQSVALSVADATVRQGDEVVVPIDVGMSLTGRDVRSFTVVLTYNSTAVTPLAVETAGTMADDLGNVSSSVDPAAREIRVAAAGSTALTGTGTLFNVRFRGESPATVTVSFDAGQTEFNQGDPPLSFTSGRITVQPLPAVTLSPSGVVLLRGETTSFTASGGSAPYGFRTVDPSIATVDANGTVTAVAPGTTRLSATDNDGVPSQNQPLIDVRAFDLSTAPVTEGQGERVEIPLEVTSLNGLDVRSGEIVLRVPTFIASLTGVETSGTLLDGVSVTASPQGDQLRIAFASATPITGAGTLLRLVVQTAPTGNGTTSISAVGTPFVNQSVLGLARGLGTIRVTPPPTLTVSPGTSTILAGETVTLTASGGQGATAWTSSDPAVATVSATGVVTGTGSGTVTITATDQPTNGTGTATVTVLGVEVDPGEVTTAPGRTVLVPIAFETPAGESIESVEARFAINNADVAPVDVVASGRLAAGWSFSTNVRTDGSLEVAGAGPAISASGVLFDLEVEVAQGATPATATVIVPTLLFNEGFPTSRIQSGAVTVAAGGNNAPVASDDAASTVEDASVLIDVLANDSDPDGDPLTITTIGGGGFGTAAVENGQVRYTPDPDASGTDTFTYTIDDGNGGTDQAPVTVTVAPINDDPLAADDAATTNEDTPVAVAVLDNDSDVDGDALTVTSVTTPASGTTAIVANGTAVEYTPAADASGTVLFSYTVSDGNGGTDQATVMVTVTPVNDAPVAVDDVVATAEDTALSFDPLTNDTDADSDALIIAGVSNPANGTATINASGPPVTYEPDADFNGTDTFTYTVSDGNGGTDQATVTVTVTPVNDPPAAFDDVASTDDATPVVIPVLANDTDPEGDALTVTSVSTPTDGTASITSGGTTVTYTPTGTGPYTDAFTYTIDDGNGGTDQATVTVSVQAVGATPMTYIWTGGAGDEWNAPGNWSPNGVPTAIDTAVVTGGPDLLISAPAVAARLVFTGGRIDADFGLAVAEFELAGGELAGDADVTVGTFAWVGVSGGTIGGTGDVTVTGMAALQFNDATLSGRRLLLTGPSILDPLVNGSDEYASLLLSDSATLEVASGATLEVRAQGNSEDTGEVSIYDSSGFSSDPVSPSRLIVRDGGTLLASGPGVVGVSGNLRFDTEGTLDLADGEWIVGFNGPMPGLFTHTGTIRGNGTLSLSIPASLDLADHFANSGVTAPGNGDGRGALTVNSDYLIPATPGGQLATVLYPTGDADLLAVAGTVSLAGSLDVTFEDGFTPSEGDAFDVLTYGARTGTFSQVSFPTIAPGLILDVEYDPPNAPGAVTARVVRVTVGSPPDANDDAASTAEDTPAVISVLANDTDPDGDNLSVTSVSAPTMGTATTNGTTVTYAPAPDVSGQDTFTYTISDGNGGDDTATVTVSITPVNDAPLAVDDAVAVEPDASVLIDVLANDSDIDGDPLSIEAITTAPTNGTAVIENGQVRYTPTTGFRGPDSFAYRIGDGGGGTDEATVSVTVADCVDLPAGAVAWWPFDETGGTTAGDLVGMNLGTHTNGPIPLSGLVDGALAFDGADDFVSVADSDLWAFGANDFTLELWASFDAPGGGVSTPGDVFLSSNDGTGTRNKWFFGLGGGALTFHINGPGVGSAFLVQAPFAPTLGQWYHLAVTRNGDTYTVYVDGVAVGAQDDSRSIPNANAPLVIGAANETFGGFMDGQLDEVTIYDQALAEGDLQAIVAAGSAGKCKPTTNQAPIAIDDTADTDEDTSVLIDVLANDSDPDGDPLAIDSASDPASGTTAIESRQVRYTPDTGFSGVDTFTYTVSDGNGGDDTATVTVSVNATANVAPIAADDVASTDDATPIVIPVLANDSDPDGDPLSVLSVVPPSDGTATTDGTIVTYTPTGAGPYTDAFAYTISDGNGGSATATVTVSVSAVGGNAAPLAVDDAATTPSATAVIISVLANDVDADGDPLAVSAVSTPSNGTATTDGLTVTYTPAAGFSGSDTFTYTASDGRGGTDTATVLVLVTQTSSVVTTFASRSAFESAAPPLSTQSFEMATTGVACAPTLDAQTDDACFDTGDILPGVRFEGETDDQTTPSYVVGAPGPGRPYTENVLALNDVRARTVLAFPSGTSALGLDVYSIVGGDGAFTLTLFDSGGASLGTLAVEAPGGGPAFFGVVSSQPIGRAVLNEFPPFLSGGSEYESIGNVSFVAPSTPPTISTTPTTPPTSGDPSTISVDAGGFTPTTAQLFYRVTGRTGYQSIPLTLVDGTYQAEIPAEAVTPRGYDYYVRLSDGTTTITDPSTNAESAPRRVRVVTDPQPAVVSVPFDGTYRMVSVPVDLADATAAAVFTDDFGTYDPTRWRLLRWLPVQERYAEFGEAGLGSVVPGLGFWLAARDGENASQPFDVEEGQSVDASEPVEITLPPGWSQIGTPFAFAVDWADVGGVGSLPAPVGYDGVEYVPGQTVLEPWQAVFVENPTNAPVTIAIPPLESGEGAERAAGARLGEASYALQMSATAGDRLRDTHNVVGFAEGATSGRDRLDWGEPPPVGEHLALSVVEGGVSLSRSLRPADAEGDTWDLRLSASPGAVASGALAVTVAFRDLAPSPDGFERYLLDLDRGAALPVVDGRARLSLSDERPAIPLRLIVGTEAFARSAAEGVSLDPAAFSLEPPRPNPSVTAVRVAFVLADPAEVVLEVFDAVGRRVTILAEGDYEAGVHGAVWDPAGELAAGIYLVRLRAGSFQAVRSVSVVR